MRTLFSCLALAMLVGALGCSEPVSDAPPKNPPAEDSHDHSAEEGKTEVSLNVPGMH